MSQATTLQLLPQTSYDSSSVVGGMISGDKQQGASYYLGNKDLQTVTWNITAFTGVVMIQASLVENPLDENDDWFTVANIIGSDTTQVSYQNINGNFVWIRANVTGFTRGVIQNVKVSY